MYVLGSVDNPASVITAPISAGETTSIAIPQARQIASALADNRQTISALVSASIADVMREYPAFNAARESDSAAYARYAVVMALLSPNLLFRHNLELAQNVCAEFPRLQTLADVESCLFITTADGRRARFNGWRNKATALFAALPYLRSIASAADVTRDSLLALRGIGPKVCAFALHMINWHAPVFTLDVHMLRLFAQIAGIPLAGNMTITSAAYRELESALIQFCRETFPQYPLFAVQWSLWNCVHGYHVAHESLFG